MRRRAHHYPLLGLLALSSMTSANLQVETVTPPSIVDNLGSMGIAGQYDGITQYTYVGQQLHLSSPYFDSIISQTNDTRFINQGTSNGRVTGLCQIGDSIYVAGNFTQIGSVDTPSGFISVNASTGDITSLNSDLNGSVLTMYCDSSSNSIYAGGNFTFQNSTGAALYNIENSSWSLPPFGGFSSGSRINSIASYNNSIIFAGLFDGLANDSFTGQTTTIGNSTVQSSQRISFNASNIISSSSADGNDPRSITCPSENSNWAMQNGDVGAWNAFWPFGFYPTKFRLYNLQQAGAGVSMFRILSFPSNGIMNLTFTNSSSSEPFYCDAWCSLPLSSDQEYVDFEFVNVIHTTGIQIEVLDTYGEHGGLSGIEIYQNDAVTYANQSYNEQDSCSSISSFVAESSLEGNFENPNVSGTSFVSVDITDSAQLSNTSVVFQPNITLSGNYSILLFTPGCIQDGTCESRGGVNVTVQSTENDEPISLTLFETNDYDKYDTIFTGIVDKISGNFRPRVILSPAAGQEVPFTLVADRIQVVLNSVRESVSINTIFEYDPANFTNIDLQTSLPVGNTTINSAGSLLGLTSQINDLHVDGDTLLVGGNFSSSQLGRSMFKITSDKVEPVAGNGLNGLINGFQNFTENEIVVFGNFSGLSNTSSVDGILNIAFYNIQDNSWSPIGQGVDGPVSRAAMLEINGTSVLGVFGSFNNAYSNTSEAISVFSSGLWVDSESAWIEQSSLSARFVRARLSASTSYNNTMFYAGYVESFGIATSGFSFVNADLSLSEAPYTFVSNPSVGNTTTLQTRNTILQTAENAVNAGAFLNSTFSILGGHFRAEADGDFYWNLLMLNEGTVKGLPNGTIDDTSTFHELYVNNGILYAGGAITGNASSNTIGGILFYDLEAGDYSSVQPPPISGDQAVVTSIEVRPNSGDLVVAGSFDQAGSLSCNSFCIYDLNGTRWKSPTPGLSGLVSSMEFIGNDVLVFAGDLELNSTRLYLAQYDFSTMEYSTFDNQSISLPGPINSFVLNGNGVDSVFASGLDSSSGDAYISHWNGSSWNRIDSVVGAGSIVTELAMLELKNSHTSNNVLPENEVLLISGNIILDNFGNASSVFFDGSSWQPAYITTLKTGGSGTVNSFFSQSSRSFVDIESEEHMNRGFVVLIALAIAVGLTFICVVLGLLVAYLRTKGKGYVLAPSRVSEAEMAETVPPASLFEEMSTHHQEPRRRASGLL